MPLRPAEGDHAYVEAPLADNTEDPPETMVEGDAVTETVGRLTTEAVNTLEYTSTPIFVATRRTYTV